MLLGAKARGPLSERGGRGEERGHDSDREEREVHGRSKENWVVGVEDWSGEGRGRRSEDYCGCSVV